MRGDHRGTQCVCGLSQGIPCLTPPVILAAGEAAIAGAFTGEERDSKAAVVEPGFDHGFFVTPHGLPQTAQGQSYASVIRRTVLARQDAGHHEDTGICWKTWILSIFPPITSK